MPNTSLERTRERQSAKFKRRRARHSAQRLERAVHPIAVIAIGAVVLAFYFTALATWSITHDPTLPRAGRIARLVIVWLAPIVAPVLILRAAAEFAPESLPGSPFLWPVRQSHTPARAALNR
jgi:hypothetical protein